jgi:hypothetical protein
VASDSSDLEQKLLGFVAEREAHAIGFTSATSMPLTFSPASTRRDLLPATSRRKAVLLPSITSVPVSANWPRCICDAAVTGAAVRDDGWD